MGTAVNQSQALGKERDSDADVVIRSLAEGNKQCVMERAL